MSFIRELRSFVETESLIERGDRLVVSVSGGVDSMALLHGLHELNEAADLHLRLHVAHLNHRLRGDASDLDSEFVQAAACDLGIPCSVECVDVRAVHQRTRGSLEEVARRERFAFLERVCVQTFSNVIAMGHHADDNAETVLHRIARGTGIRGLAGIAPQRAWRHGSGIRLIRPLLSHRKAQLAAFLTDRGVTWREDASNASEEYTRNQIRNTVIPLLAQEINPQVTEALSRLAEQARWLQAYLQETAQRQFESLIVHSTDQELVLNARALSQKGRIIAAELVRRAVLHFQLGEQDLNFSHLKNVVELAGAPVSGKQVKLPGGLRVTRQYDRLHFTLPTEQPREEIAPEVLVHVPGTTVLAKRRMEIQAAVVETGFEDLQSWKREKPRSCEWMDYDEVHPPLLVRARRPGDRFWPLGSGGSKKLGDFFIDAKIDPERRRHVAILCDQLGPIWVMPFRIDERVKVTRTTRRVLQLTARQW